MEARKKRPSGTHCAAMWSNNYVGCRADKISLHRFPKCPTRCAKWLDFCGRRDLLGKSPIHLRHHRVCSDHFIQPYFKLNGSRIALEPYAVPTVLVKGAPGSQELTDMVAAGSPSVPPLVAEEVCRAVEPSGERAKYRRLQLLNEKGVPTQTEVREQLGSPLAEIFFDSLNERCRELMGLTPHLVGPKPPLWVSPSHSLLDRLVLSPPRTSRHLRAEMHESILAVGEVVVKKFRNQMRIEMLNILTDMEKGINQHAKETIKSAIKSIHEEERERCEESKAKLVHKFMKLITDEITTVQHNKNNKTHVAIQNERAELHELMEDQTAYAIETTRQNLTTHYEREMESSLKQEEEKFFLFLRYVKEETTMLLIDLQTKHIQDLQRLKCEMEVTNLADVSYAVAEEREHSVITKTEMEAEFTTRIAALKSLIEEKITKISMFKTTSLLLTDELKLWEERVRHIVHEFQRYINYVMRSMPGHADFMLSLEKLLTLETQLIGDLAMLPDVLKSENEEAKEEAKEVEGTKDTRDSKPTIIPKELLAPSQEIASSDSNFIALRCDTLQRNMGYRDSPSRSKEEKSCLATEEEHTAMTSQDQEQAYGSPGRDSKHKTSELSSKSSRERHIHLRPGTPTSRERSRDISRDLPLSEREELGDVYPTELERLHSMTPSEIEELGDKSPVELKSFGRDQISSEQDTLTQQIERSSQSWTQSEQEACDRTSLEVKKLSRYMAPSEQKALAHMTPSQLDRLHRELSPTEQEIFDIHMTPSEQARLGRYSSLSELQSLSQYRSPSEQERLGRYRSSTEQQSFSRYRSLSDKQNFSQYKTSSDMQSFHQYGTSSDMQSSSQYRTSSDMPSFNQYRTSSDMQTFSQYNTAQQESLNQFRTSYEIPQFGRDTTSSELHRLGTHMTSLVLEQLGTSRTPSEQERLGLIVRFHSTRSSSKDGDRLATTGWDRRLTAERDQSVQERLLKEQFAESQSQYQDNLAEKYTKDVADETVEEPNSRIGALLKILKNHPSLPSIF